MMFYSYPLVRTYFFFSDYSDYMNGLIDYHVSRGPSTFNIIFKSLPT